MKQFLMRRALIIITFICLVSVCNAQVLVSESFDYSEGSLAGQNGGTGFSGSWQNLSGTTSSEVRSGDGEWGPVTPPYGYIGASDSYAQFNGDGSETFGIGRDLQTAIDFDPAEETTYYFSMLFRRRDWSNGGGSEMMRFFDLRDDNDSGTPLMIAGTDSDEQGWALLGGYGNNVFTSSSAFQITGDEIYNNLMIAKLTVRSGGNDELSMNFYETGTNSVSLTEPTSWDLSYENTVSGTSSSIGISVQKWGGSGHIDELKIATEYSEVLPGKQTTIETNADTYVAEGAPNANYGAQGNLRAAGFDSSGSSPAGRKRIFLGFDDCNSIPAGSTIRNVSFRAYQTDGSTVSDGMDMFRLNSLWNEDELSWGTMPADYPDVLLNTGQLPQGEFTVNSDGLRYLVQDWVGHNEKNFGLSLRIGNSESRSNGDTLASRENSSPGSLGEAYPAQLDITYYPPGDANNLWVSQIEYSHPETNTYIGSPSIVRAPDGSVLASHDHFGGGTDNTTSVYRSTDKGLSWEKISEIRPLYFATLFVHDSSVYLLGVDGPQKSIVIHRSDDNGYNWTSADDAYSGLLFAGGEDNNPPNYGKGPCPVVKKDGKIYAAVADKDHSYPWPGANSAVICGDLDGNLLHATNWTISNEIILEKSMVPDDWSASHPGWIEGNVVLTPTNDIYNILRVSTSVAVDEPVIDKAAIHKFDSETSTLSFNPDKGFIDFPGGNHKFTIRRDPVTGAYLSLVNNNTDPNESRQRNILSLSWSQDLVHWKLIETLIEDDLPVSWEESLSQTGFQYVDWQFDGDDIIYVSRTSYDGAHNYHDANRLTFDRIENYASRIPIPGDFNGDREVNFKDFAQISSSLMASEGEQGWDKKYNFAEPHDEIDMVDFSVFAENWLLSGY